jgi:hypothetical protein
MVITLPLCVLYGSQEQAENISLYSIHRLDFITEAESVYSAVRTESFYDTHTFCLLKVKCGVKYDQRKEGN